MTGVYPQRLRGVLWALAAGLFWGGAFLAPLVLPGYTALEITAGRFAGSGLFSLVMLGSVLIGGRTQGLRAGSPWLAAFGLAMVGNFLYFVATVAGVQRANAPIVTLIIGTLPIAIPLVAQLRDGTFSWRTTLLPSLLILAGLLCVHYGADGPASGNGSIDLRYLSGIGLAIVALLAWLVFALANDRAMKRYGSISAATWSSMQGVALLPVALPLLAVTVLAGATHGGGDRAPMATFLLVSLGLGIATSWIAMWCWNNASRALPPALAGQLLVFETIASLSYTYLWFQAWPPLLVVGGAACLIGGVILGVRRLSSQIKAGERSAVP